MKQFLTPKQIKQITDEIKSKESMLSDPTISGRLDPLDMRRSIDSKKKMLRENSPQPLKGEAQNKAYKKYKQLARWIQANAPKESETPKLYPNSKSKHGADFEFERSVKKMMNWIKNGQRVVDAYRHIGARIDPNNMELRSVKRLMR